MPVDLSFFDAASRGDLDALNAHLARADVASWINDLSGTGLAAAHLAAQLGHESVLAALASAGADLNVKARGQMTPQGARPLHVAIAAKHAGAVRVLLERGADPNAPQDDGQTPLHAACATDGIEIVRLLLDRGANFNAQASDGRKPIACAAQRGQQPIVELLRQRGAALEPMGPADFNFGARLSSKL